MSRHSFNPPFTNNQIAFWDAGAGAFVNTSYVRLTPARQSRTGYIWNNVKQSSMTDWEVIFEFQVSGMRHLGGDGFAFWYVEKPELLGTVYGSQDYWIGLGLFFDTFNNDGRGENPLITAQFNDGTQKFNQADDGDSTALAKCSFPFRNLQQPAACRVTYLESVLTVEIALHRDGDGNPQFVDCLRADNVELGVDKYFGLTAHTGDVADNHDIVSFIAADISPPNSNLNAARERFKQKIQLEHAKPQHQELGQRDFQHEVLTLLNQIQESVNLMELSQIGVENMLRQTAVQLGQAGQAGQGAAQQPPQPPQPPPQQPPAPPVNNQAMESLFTRLDELRVLLNSARLDAPNGQLQPALLLLESNLKALVTNAQGQIQAVVRSSLEAEMRKVTDQIRILTNDQRQLQSQLATQAESGSAGPGVIVYLLLIANLVGIAAIGFLSRKKEDRFSKFV
jgi:hypothetical protein